MPFDVHPWVDGRRRGWAATTLRGGLRIVSWGYRAVVAIRNRRYDRGRHIESIGVPVLCVGNLTTGGTGKTPAVAAVCRRLRQRGVRVAIVSRGYGRGEAGVNDEAMELYDRLPDVPHVQDPDRVAAARIAVRELESEFIVMDDGFGHRRLHRDADVVLIDATCPWGHGFVLPRGLMREPPSSLGRAALVMLTRCDQVDAPEVESIRRAVAGHFAGPVLTSRHRASGLRRDGGDTAALDHLAGQPVALFSAIGNPAAFERSVAAAGMTVVGHRRMPDHAAIDSEAMEGLRRWIGGLETPPAAIVCTHKDLVKLRTDRVAGKPLWALQIDLDLDDPGGELDRLIDRLWVTDDPPATPMNTGA